MNDENAPPSNIIQQSVQKPAAAPKGSFFSRFMNSSSPRARLGKFALLATIIFSVVFLTNAAIVATSLYSASNLSIKDLKIQSVSLNDLCEEAATLEVKGSVKRRKSFDFFLVSASKPVQIKVLFPDAKDSNGKQLPHFVSIQVPSFSFGRGHLKFDFTGSRAIKITPNQQFKLKHLAEYLLNESSSGKKVALEIEGILETSSFWIPLSFDRKDKVEFVIKPNKTSNAPSDEETFSVETIELLDHADPNHLEVGVNVHIPEQLLPKYLTVAFPSFGLEIGFKKVAEAQDRIYPVAAVSIEAFNLSPTTSNLSFQISLNRSHKEAILDLLRKMKGGADDIELAIRGLTIPSSEVCDVNGNGCHMCSFQRLINTFEASKPYSALGSMMPLTNPSPSLSTRTLDAPEIISVGLIGVQQSNSVPRFNFEIGVSKEFISKAIGYDIRKIRGKLPPLALKNILESSHANATLAKLDIEHFGDSAEGSSVNFGVSLSFLDACEASKFAAHLAFVGIESPTRMMDEIGNYRRLYFKGLEDTLLSSIASIYEIELPLLQRSDVSTDEVLFSVPGYSFSAPAEGSLLHASHNIAASITQNARRAELNLVCKLNNEALVSNPVVRFYWGDLDVTIKNEEGVSSAPLVSMSVSRGQFHLSLSPNNPLHLVHKGVIQASIHADGATAPDQLLESWKSLFFNVLNSSDYTNVMASFSIGGRIANVELAVPPYSLIESSQASSLSSSRFIKKSQLRVVGLRGSTIQALLKLPAMNSCPHSSQPLSSSINFDMNIPRVEANLCSFKDDAFSNLMKVGVYPMKISGKIADRSFCDLRIEMNYQNPEQDTFAAEDSASEVRTNWIPLSATIVDFEKLLEVFDEAAAGSSPSFLSTCQDSGLGDEPSLLNKIINYAGSTFKFKPPSSAPRIEPVKRPAITSFVNEPPAKLELTANSPNRHQLEGSFKMVIPEECLPRRAPESIAVEPEDDSLMTVQWGSITIVIEDGQNVFKLKVCQGHVEIRLDEGTVRLEHRTNASSSDFTNAFEASFQVNLDKRNFNSGDIRRFIHNLYSYVMDDTASHIVDKNIGSRTVLMKASMLPFVRQDEEAPPDSPVSGVVSTLHIKTLLSLAKAMLKRAGSRPSHLDDLWSLWRSQVELLPPSEPRTLDFPCLLPSMCANGLLSEPSKLQPLFPMKIEISHFVQLMCESTALGIGRLLSKLDLASHPRKLQLSITSTTDVFVASSLNDIDIVEAHVKADQMSISRIATIVYPDEITEGSDVVVQQVRDIMEDTFTIVMDLSLAKYYHDISGALHHISIDPLFRMALDPIPKYTTLTGDGEVPAPLYQSPLNAYASTERVEHSNLLSTLCCVFIAEMPMGSIVAALGSSTLIVSSCLGARGKPSSSFKTELEVSGMGFPNPSRRVNLKISRPITGTYLYKRDEPLPSDPVDGFHIASGRIEPLENESFPLIFEAATNHPILLFGTLSFDADGLDPNRPEDRAIIQNFASRAALGKEMSTIMEIDMTENLLMRMKLDYPPRDFDLSFFDSEHSGIDFRSINKVTQSMYEAGKVVSNVLGSVANKLESLKGWAGSLWGNSAEQSTGSDSSQTTEETAPKPGTPPNQNAKSQTGGTGFTDINFALALRNPGDFTMAVNSLKIGLTIDDNDGLLHKFPTSVSDKKLRGSLMLAHHDCHPSKFPTAQTFDDFLKCTHKSPAKELAPNEHLLGNFRLLAPVAFEKKINYVQAIDEITNHDGLCLDIDGTFSLGILDNADGRFDLDLPVEVKRVPIPRFTFPAKPLPEESKKNLKFQTDFDPCFKLKKNSEIVNRHEILSNMQLWYSLANEPLTSISASSPLMIAGRSTKSYVASLMLTDKISFESSILYEFTFEFKRTMPFHTYPGFAFVWHANEAHTAVGSGEYGYGGIEKSLALAIHPYTNNSVKLLHDGQLANVLYEKNSAVFPKNYLDRKLHVSLRYVSFDRRFILDVQGEGDDFVYHSIINIEREPDDSQLSRGPSLSSMVGSTEGWFGITANSTGYLDIVLSSFKLNAIEPNLENTKVFWPNYVSSLPGEEGQFVIRLTDHAGFAMAEVSGNIKIKLRRIKSSHPRSVINIPDDVSPSKHQSSADRVSFLQFPQSVETECTINYRPSLGLYDVFYKASLPGRYEILMSYEDGQWTKVQWSTIYIRHIW